VLVLVLVLVLLLVLLVLVLVLLLVLLLLQSLLMTTSAERRTQHQWSGLRVLGARVRLHPPRTVRLGLSHIDTRRRFGQIFGRHAQRRVVCRRITIKCVCTIATQTVR